MIQETHFCHINHNQSLCLCPLVINDPPAVALRPPQFDNHCVSCTHSLTHSTASCADLVSASWVFIISRFSGSWVFGWRAADQRPAVNKGSARETSACCWKTERSVLRRLLGGFWWARRWRWLDREGGEALLRAAHDAMWAPISLQQFTFLFPQTLWKTIRGEEGFMEKKGQRCVEKLVISSFL